MTDAEIPRYANVWIEGLPADAAHPYSYRVPPELEGQVRVGSVVEIPFGARNKVNGFVVGYPVPAPSVTARAIRRVIQAELIPESLHALLGWVSEHYACSLAQVYQAALPRGALRGEIKAKTAQVATLTGGLGADLTARQIEIVGILTAAGGQMSVAALLKAGRTTSGLLKTLEGRGAIAVSVERVWRTPDMPLDPARIGPTPTPDQLAAIESITHAPPGSVFLLQGVTGSGKTEVYLRTIAETLARGDQALVLVPEIALTPQTVARFRARFGERIAVLHSALGEGERFDEWQRLRDGDALVGIGARSAIFAPLRRLGLIVLDEEHEGSYKQDSAPRYHARSVALRRAELEGARVILGSATPCLESHHAARQGRYGLLRLDHRINAHGLPPVEVVDMRAELAAGHRSMFSRRLQSELEGVLARQEQAILLLNRRGYASFVLCRSCGEAICCPLCSVSLTYHRAGESLRCHYCDHREAMPERCPGCRSPYIRHFGAGTQQVAEAVQKLFPDARLLRLDRDTTQRKGSHRTILEQFTRGDADLLIGTQMVAKGLDMPRVTLVGVMAADTSLNLPDFRASERTFQLLTQVAGRAGRGEAPGVVVVQTYAPEHPAVVFARTHDVDGFVARELEDREALSYPPFGSLIHLVWSAPERDAAWRSAEVLCASLAAHEALMVLGPAEAPLALLRGRHRVQALIKCADLAVARGALRDALRGAVRVEGVRLAIDVDPYSLL